MSEVTYEQACCTKCGRIDSVPIGHLTEEGKKAYRCGPCKAREDMPMEARVSEQQHQGKKLLTEDLPNI